MWARFSSSSVRFVAVAIATLFIASSPSVASTPQSSSGTFGPTGSGTITTRTADGNVIIDIAARPGAFTGTFAGTYSEDLRIVVHKDGSDNFSAELTCACVVDGRTGTMTVKLDGTGSLPGGTFQAHYRIVAGTGDLANLRGEGMLSFPPPTYSGEHHFD
jgi:hypothetical protein